MSMRSRKSRGPGETRECSNWEQIIWTPSKSRREQMKGLSWRAGETVLYAFRESTLALVCGVRRREK